MRHPDTHSQTRTSIGLSVRTLLGLLLTLIVPGSAWAHPQDGPHAEIRLSIEDAQVRQTINLNLAFIDEILPMTRESLAAVAPSEAARIQRDLQAWLADNATVTIDGEPATPTFELVSMNTEPEPGMVALYPRVGVRGLIRVLTRISYPTDSPPQSVSFAWPAYPDEILIEEATPKPMFLEAQLRAEGSMGIVRFSQAEPTVDWKRGESGVLFDQVPPVPETRPSHAIALSTLALAGGALVTLIITLVRIGSQASAATAIATIALAVGAWFLPAAGPALTLSRDESTPLDQDLARSVLTSLHANIYNAFEYTSESDIYDALALSVDGSLLDELYQQVYTSLIQAEQDGMVGVVTDLEPLDFQLNRLDEANAFDATLSWRVDGTVYHWGHTHTRTNEYQAQFTVAPTDEGWRITSQRIINQRRIDDGLGNTPQRPIGEI